MIYHDILGVTIFANASQIEDAYNKHINTLKERKLDSECPELYSRKVKELSKAKAECLAYIKESFGKKVELESKECAGRALSPNVSYSCCCGDECATCCGVICLIWVGGSLVSIALGIKGKSDEHKERVQAEERRQRTEKLNNLYRKEREEATRLNSELPGAKRMFEEAKCKHEKLKTKLSVFESKLSIVNKFLYNNGVSLDLKESASYVALFRQVDNSSKEEQQCKNRISEIESDLSRIEDHERERQRFLNNRVE